MPDPSVPTAIFLLLFAESLLFGAFCILYLFSLWVLVYRQRRHRRSAPSHWMTAIVTTMFLLSGLHLLLDVVFPLKAFIEHSGTPNGPLDYLNQEANNSFFSAAQPLIFLIMIFIGDGFMTYRIYIVWTRQLISLAVPIILLIGDLVAAIFTAKALRTGTRTYYSSLAPNSRAEQIAYFSMILLTNVVTTLLLVGRLWWSDKRIKKYRTRDVSVSVHWQVMKTVIQSEVAYSLGVVLNLAAYAAHSNLAILTGAILPSLLGVSFTLIITRIGVSEMLGEGSDSHPRESNTMQLNERGRALSPIAVNVFITRTEDSQDADSHCDKPVPVCDESLSERDRTEAVA